MQLRCKGTKIKVLEEAYEAFVKMAETYAAEHHLAESDKKAVLDMIRKAYIEKKAAYLLTEKLGKMNSYLQFSWAQAVQEPKDRNERRKYNIAYVKHLKQIVAND